MRNSEIRKKQYNTVMKYSITIVTKSGSVTLILKTYLEANTLHFSSTLRRKLFWNENGWPVVFISRRLTDMHGIRFMRGFKEGGSGITPFLGKFKFNKFTLFNFWNGPWTRLENKIISCPSTLQHLSRSAHETGNGTYAPTHFEFPLVRPSVCQNY